MKIKLLPLKMLLMPCSVTKMIDFAFIDSGTGGIPYLLEMKKRCPESDCVYVGDTANFPYGEKSHEEIVSCITAVVARVIERFEPAVIVIACNTISVNALEVLRMQFPAVEFVGTVPAIKLAAKVSKNRKIGLLATKSTCENPYNIDLKNKFAADCEMVLRPDADLISFIEHCSFTASLEERKNACRPAAEFFKQNGCDVIILGCTHFLNIKEEMQVVCGNEVQVVDSVDGVVNHAIEVKKGRCGETNLFVAPLEGVAEKPAAKRGLWSEGEASPYHPLKDVRFRERYNGGEVSPYESSLVFVTGFNDKNDEKEYDVLCNRYNLKFGGKL